MVKLIVTDIDGTLIQEGGNSLNPEYFTVIRQLYEKGIRVAVASGRNTVSVRNTFRPVLDYIYIFSQNGSVIEEKGVTEVIHPLREDWAREIWSFAGAHREEAVEAVVDTAECIYCPNEGTSMYRFLNDEYHMDPHAVGGWENFPNKGQLTMMTIYHPDSAEEFCRKHGMFEYWKGRLNLLATGKTWVDILVPGNSKGEALLYTCEKLQIDPKDTIAFGDNLNDISMIEAAGIGYAVASAREEVKKAADRVIPGFEEDGVLKEWKKLL